MIDKARENNIVLFKLIAHSSHILQPLDYGVFGPAKVAWKKSLDKHFKDNGLVDVSNADFPGLMKNVYDKAFKPEHALKGFEACGIFPLNREKITDEKLKIGKIFSEKRTEQEEEEDSNSELEIVEDLVTTPKQSKLNNKNLLSTIKNMCNSICKSQQKEQQEFEKKIQKKNADSIAKSVVIYKKTT